MGHPCHSEKFGSSHGRGRRDDMVSGTHGVGGRQAKLGLPSCIVFLIYE